MKESKDHSAVADAGGVQGPESAVDEYGNPIDGNSLPFCCFPDCGCDGARLCMAESGANPSSCNMNIERGQKVAP